MDGKLMFFKTSKIFFYIKKARLPTLVMALEAHCQFTNCIVLNVVNCTNPCNSSIAARLQQNTTSIKTTLTIELERIVGVRRGNTEVKRAGAGPERAGHDGNTLRPRRRPQALHTWPHTPHDEGERRGDG